MNGIAWTIADTSEIPRHRDYDEWIVLKFSMGILGTAKSGEQIPMNLQKVIVPPFLMVATDREAVKKEIVDKIDGLFDAWEHNAKLDCIQKAGG